MRFSCLDVLTYKWYQYMFTWQPFTYTQTESGICWRDETEEKGGIVLTQEMFVLGIATPFLTSYHSFELRKLAAELLLR